MRILVSAALLAVVSAVTFWSGTEVFSSRTQPDGTPHDAGGLAVIEQSPGWEFRTLRVLAEAVNSLVVAPEAAGKLRGYLYAGTAGAGGVVRLSTWSQGEPMVISAGLGDMIRFGLCHVNRLALHDLDGDGKLDLLASTSQVNPRGRPKVCAWSTDFVSPAQVAMARPDIRSSWSHSLGFLRRPGSSPPASVFSTFCGFGEVVEYRMDANKADTGFVSDSLAWKVVGQLPASGEWLEVADADNDGRDEVCVATGFALNQAEVRLYASDAPGAPLRLEQSIDEGKRFGNVRFTVAPLGSAGERQVLAWWCTEIAGGDAELILYRLGAEGVRERNVLARGPAAHLWSDDGQFATGDLDGDGHDEVWFATPGGHLWRYAPAVSPKPERVARFKDSLGPIAIGPDYDLPRQRLFLGWKKTIFSLDLAGKFRGLGSNR